MIWNWQQSDWPHFNYNKASLSDFDEQFLQSAWMTIGVCKHLSESDKNILLVDIISSEAIKTSEIEGEFLNRDSVQASILRKLGLETDNRRLPPAEQGIAAMMVDLYLNFAVPLTHDQLFKWHKMITNGRNDLRELGQYRSVDEPMQVVSGPIYDPNVHFEAPPSDKVWHEMECFIKWFNKTAPTGESPLSPLIRAGIAHWYFVCIHPFEDGNGRIARALAEKVLSQHLGQATLLALSYAIEKNKKDYYAILERSSKKNEITAYLAYFAKRVLAAQNYTQKNIEFILHKTRLYDKLRGLLNERQEKALNRIFREGIEGFTGGLSADKYIRLTKTSRATATRDLQDLVEKGALIRTGERKNTRYFINVDLGG